MSTRSQKSAGTTPKFDHPSLALTTSYDEEIAPLLTAIDRIRNRIADIDTSIDLPSIVVIGEQSSGKSSVLEALSGIPLPRGGQHMTTKCPLELRMRHGSAWKASLECSGRIVQDSIAKPDEIGQCITREQDSLTKNRNQISKQVLQLNIHAPWLPNLTLIDLPGIIQVASRQQDSSSVNIIEELIKDYLDKSSTIILAIVQACTDIETSAAIKYARMFDPDGERTIGVLTKLDLVDRGTEQKLLEVFDNKRIPLKHGYIMVKCRSQEDINSKIKLEEALHKEEQFFLKSPKFQNLPVARRGCPLLARFLTRELVRNIKQTIPNLISDLRIKINYIEQQLRHLGIDDYEQLLLTNEARSRCLTEKLFASMQAFRAEIHSVEEGAQSNNPLYSKRNELNQQFYNDMHNCKLDNNLLVQLIKTAMIATQGPEPSDYILFRVTKTVCLNYIKAIRSPMEKYLSNMLERTNNAISNIMNKVFQTRPNLLDKMRSIHGIIEQQLKSECHRELELMLEMEESFVYADNPLYRDTLRRTKRIHRMTSSDTLSSTTVVPSSRLSSCSTANASKSSTTASLKRKNDACHEDNNDDEDNGLNPPNKSSRSSKNSSSNLLSSFLSWKNPRQDLPDPSISANNETRPASELVASSKPGIPSSTVHILNENSIDEEIIEYRIRILTMQDIICQRIVLTFPQRVEYQLVRRQFSQLDLKSSIIGSTSLEQLDYLMMHSPDMERRQNELINKRKIYDETLQELQILNQHQSNLD